MESPKFSSASKITEHMKNHSDLLNCHTHLTILVNGMLITSSLQEQQNWPDNNQGKKKVKFLLSISINFESKKNAIKLFFCLIAIQICQVWNTEKTDRTGIN